MTENTSRVLRTGYVILSSVPGIDAVARLVGTPMHGVKKKAKASLAAFSSRITKRRGE